MTTASPTPKARTIHPDRLRIASAPATRPNGTAAETRAGYLHAIAPPASRPARAQMGVGGGGWGVGKDSIESVHPPLHTRPALPLLGDPATSSPNPHPTVQISAA